MTGKYIFIFLIVHITWKQHSSQVMNLFLKSYRICLIFFLITACESSLTRGIAQDYTLFPHPWIQEINLPQDFADIPNQSFYLDGNVSLFIGKDNGINIISGNGISHLQMDGPVYISGNGSDTIYYACENDIGYMLKDKSGKFTVRSQKDRISRANSNFIPSQLICMDEAVFVNTDRGVYQFLESQIKYHPFADNKGRLHLIEGQLILRMNQLQIHRWNGEGFHKMTESEISQDSLLMIPGELERNKDLSFLDYITINEVIAISKKQGLVILDREGNIAAALGSRGGLPDNHIKQISKSEGDELWILGSHSLHKINYPSTLSILQLAPEDFGLIYASESSGRSIILGTSLGLYFAEPVGSGGGAWNIRNITGKQACSFHLVTSVGTTIFAAGSGRLVSIHGEILDEIATGSFTGLQAISPELVVASGEDGMESFQRTPQGWSRILYDTVHRNSFSFARFNDNIFLICKNEVHMLPGTLDGSRTIPFLGEDLLHKLVTVDNQLYLITDTRVYRFDENEDKFNPVEKQLQASILWASDIIISGENSGHWMVRHQGKYKSDILHLEAGKTEDPESLSYPILQNLGHIIDLNIRDSMLYLTGMDKILLFNLRLLPHEKGRQRPLIELETVSLADESAEIRISGLEFQSNPEPEFRYKLVPELENWSDWSTSRNLIFNRLKPGKYAMYAQSKDLFGKISDTAEIHFSIKAPFYISWYAYAFYGFALLIILFLILKLRLLSYRQAVSRVSQRMQLKLDDLTHEKEKSDKIVSDILPDRTAQQMRLEGKAKWDKYDRATVLFSDIQGFTKIAEEMNPEALIDELDQFFFHFDSVVEKYNIEKIKTIGDAYMAAGGIPEKNSTNPVEVVLAALEMQAYMQKLKTTKTDIWDLRIGIHTGPVIAGVVGHKKVSYDIWGDTVNTASRMESSGIPGKVNISGITYGMVKDYFICEYRGRLPVKYKGNIDMYFVNGLRPELSVDLKGIPNKRFFTKLQLLRLGDLEERVFETILSNLPDNLYFHNIEYARKVYNHAFLLCRAEEVEEEDRLLVRTAALMLYTGLTQAYSNYENRSSVIAREILHQYKYSELQTDRICNLIMSTKLPFQPNNLLEKILIDAKMEYIGRPDYTDRIKLLYKELVETGATLNGQQFKKQQLERLYTFDFFTVAAKRLREIPGEVQQTSLEQERWI